MQKRANVQACMHAGRQAGGRGWKQQQQRARARAMKTHRGDLPPADAPCRAAARSPAGGDRSSPWAGGCAVRRGGKAGRHRRNALRVCRSAREDVLPRDRQSVCRYARRGVHKGDGIRRHGAGRRRSLARSLCECAKGALKRVAAAAAVVERGPCCRCRCRCIYRLCCCFSRAFNCRTLKAQS
eukprot:365981-Chlamydomonas_euryale.AAC.5